MPAHQLRCIQQRLFQEMLSRTARTGRRECSRRGHMCGDVQDVCQRAHLIPRPKDSVDRHPRVAPEPVCQRSASVHPILTIALQVLAQCLTGRSHRPAAKRADERGVVLHHGKLVPSSSQCRGAVSPSGLCAPLRLSVSDFVPQLCNAACRLCAMC
jgi:hypothetical protein